MEEQMTQGQSPFRVMLRMEIQPGREQEFERTWIGIGDVIAGNPGNLGQWLMRSAERANEYYIISDWLDEDVFRAFEHSDEHVGHRTKLQPFRTAGQMWTTHVVTFLPGAAEGVSA
jgi:heme-degrading monooxygenase HmoA